MAYGVALNLLGMALILAGGFKAAREMGEVERVWMSTRVWVSDRARDLKAVIVRVVLRRKEPVVVSTGSARMALRAGATGVAVGEMPWDSMGQDEKLEVLKKRHDALRGLVDQNDERSQGRLDDVEARMTEFESTVDDRFGGHDVRDLSVLRYELAGGAISLVGSVIILIS